MGKLTKKQLARRRRIRAQRTRRGLEAEQRLKMQQNGLVVPPTVAIGTPEFDALRADWYKRIAETGPKSARFQDIEWTENPDSPFIKRAGTKARMLTPGKELYFRLARNYLTHGGLNGRKRFAWELHVEGLSYRRILKRMQDKYGLDRSVYWVFYFVQDIAKKMLLWNKTHAEGMLNPANVDSFADDALISDFGLAIAQPYELKLPRRG